MWRPAGRSPLHRLVADEPGECESVPGMSFGVRAEASQDGRNAGDRLRGSPDSHSGNGHRRP